MHTHTYISQQREGPVSRPLDSSRRLRDLLAVGVHTQTSQPKPISLEASHTAPLASPGAPEVQLDSALGAESAE